jgi:hypothetical protein
MYLCSVLPKMKLMIDENILREKAKKYLVCFHATCPRREHCLRWIASHYVPERLFSVICINPNHVGDVTDSCIAYRDDQPQRVPVGMVHFYEAMPGAMERAIKSRLIEYYSRVIYYRYRRGELLITPDVEQVIERVCRECGWTAPLVFDGYSEELLW